MFGVTLNGSHSYDDLGLIFVTRQIGSPEPQTKFVSVPGRNGAIDMSEVLGGVRYNNRNISIKFRTFAKYDEREELMSELLNEYHGKNVKLIFDDDTDHFFYGRCSIGAITVNGTAGDLDMEFNCQPFRYDITDENMTGGDI